MAEPQTSSSATGCVAPAVTVVMVSHNSGPLLLQSLKAVLSQELDADAARPLALEVILVDNASREGQLDGLPGDSRLRLLLNPDNRGFAVACNQAAALARGTRLLMLNPDCLLPTGALDALLHAQNRQGVDLLGACLLNADGSVQAASYRRDPRPLRAVRQALGLNVSDDVRRGDVRGKDIHGSARQEGDVSDVEAMSGALMLIETSRFIELGGFDGGFRLHVEDLDLCRRAREAGLRVAVDNTVRVPHIKGTSSQGRPFWVEWQKHRGMWRYFRKHDASRVVWPLKALLWCGLWAHWLLAAPVAWLRSRRGNA